MGNFSFPEVLVFIHFHKKGGGVIFANTTYLLFNEDKNDLKIEE